MDPEDHFEIPRWREDRLGAIAVALTILASAAAGCSVPGAERTSDGGQTDASVGQGDDAGAGEAGASDGGDAGAFDAGPDAGLVDPVTGSQGDPTLPGVDADGNGVRDDVDAYIATLESDALKRIAITSFARELTGMMVLGGGVAPATKAAYAQHVRIVQTIDCLATLYSSKDRRTLINNVQYALLNNAARQRAYHRADGLLSGTILPAPGKGCDPGVTGVGE